MSIQRLLEEISMYQPDAKHMILKAYYYAEVFHRFQKRQSGEPYIEHPLQVAFILSQLKADPDTICAALLHDTIEDTPLTKEVIAKAFNSHVATLVDGVTKLKGLNFSSKKDRELANTRKILSGMMVDVRIVLIKLADRLHNMRTLESKSSFKQKENAMETMEIFVPLADCLGAHEIQKELEDIALSYLMPEVFQFLSCEKIHIQESSQECLEEVVKQIHNRLQEQNVSSQIRIRTKSISSIYKKLRRGYQLYEIHDLLALKVIVSNIEDCYRTLGLVHSLYPPMNEKFKDYICNPKTNRYQSLHTTVFGPDDHFVQVQIRTEEMDKMASFGLAAYWHKPSLDMQKVLKENYQFFKALKELDKSFNDNQDFIQSVKEELFTDNVYVYTTKGDIIELPKGSTPIDFAYKIHTDIGHHMSKVVVNNHVVPFDYELKNKDRISILTSDKSMGPNENWLIKSKTSNAKRKIKEYIKKKG